MEWATHATNPARPLPQAAQLSQCACCTVPAARRRQAGPPGGGAVHLCSAGV